MKYLVLDAETNIKNVGDEAVGDFSGNPYHPDNFAVWFGALDDEGNYSVYDMRSTQQPPFFKEASYLVAHNAKFDLTYLRKHWPADYQAWAASGKRVWCTQLAEYLLSGQQTKKPSLDSLAEGYGGHLKDSRMKEYWNAGIDTADIPEDEILPYLEGDVRNTHRIFIAQLKLARELGMVKLILSQMDALLCTAEMQWNGMHFDKALALREAQQLRKQSDELRETLIYQMQVVCPDLQEPNPASNDHISIALFGGTVFVREDKPVLDDDSSEPVRYKTGARKGEIKTKKVDVPYKQDGFAVVPEQKWLTNKVGIYQVGDEILTVVEAKNKKHETLLAFINAVRQLRAIEKDLGTYFIGYSDLTWHDSKIRGEHNHCVTVTGRLSSSAPNMQNVSNKERD